MLDGHVHPDFWQVARMLRRHGAAQRSGGRMPSASTTAASAWWICGRGSATPQGRPLASRDTVSLSYSTSKGVLATLLHVLVDRGSGGATTSPVCRYWPEFGARRQGPHHATPAALPRGGPLPHRRHARRRAAHARLVHTWWILLERSSPVHPPGEAHGYHALTYGWLVGELIQRIGQALTG